MSHYCPTLGGYKGKEAFRQPGVSLVLILFMNLVGVEKEEEAM